MFLINPRAKVTLVCKYREGETICRFGELIDERGNFSRSLAAHASVQPDNHVVYRLAVPDDLEDHIYIEVTDGFIFFAFRFRTRPS